MNPLKIFWQGILILLILLCLSSHSLASNFSEYGNGTIDNPYRISSPEEFSKLQNDFSAHYILMNDLDFYNKNELWKPVGNMDDVFKGTLNGNNKCISNLTIRLEADEQYAGLFAKTGKGSQIYDLTIINMVVENGRYAGSLAGYNSGEVQNCHAVDVIIYSAGSSGGLVGTNYGGTIKNCSVQGKVTGNDSGGFVGINNQGQIENCFASAEVTGNDSAGGFTGRNYIGVIQNCYSEGPVKGNKLTGGFAGGNHKGDIEYCYTANSVDSKIETGGFVGVNQGCLENCIAVNDYINNRPFFSKETSPYPPYIHYIFGAGPGIGRITSANYYAGPDDYAVEILNCYSRKETSTNRFLFRGINGKVVKTGDIEGTFPDSIWSGWNTDIWKLNQENPLPVLAWIGDKERKPEFLN